MLVYINFQLNTMHPTSKPGDLPYVDTRHWVKQQVQLTYSPDHVDEDNLMFNAQQQSFRDGDNGDSDLGKSSTNSNNILAK